MGIFIRIEADARQVTAELSAQLAQICPVDIFESAEGMLVIKPEREDECTLCNLCLHAAPPGALSIYKLYNGEIMTSNGNGQENGG